MEKADWFKQEIKDVEKKLETNIRKSKEKELNSLIDSASVNDSASSELSEELNKVNSQIGLTSLQGEGIIIKITDGEESDILPTETTVVHDSDLKAIVNDLCIGGAEAISINGQRIVSTTAITCIGNVIKINDEKVGSPFEIRAIGSKAELDGNVSMNGRTISLMKKAGISVKITRSDTVVIPKYDGIFTANYIN